MRIENYFYAIEIADTGSFSQAARNLYVSQPNLSHIVKQLEEEAGFPIFVRTPSGVVPTPEGRDLIEHFRVIQRECEQVDSLLHPDPYPRRLGLRVATLNVGRAVPAFAELIRKYIGSPINFSFMNYSFLKDLLPLVETCQVDFAIIGTVSSHLRTVLGELHNRDIEYRPLADIPISALVGPRNPLYGQKDAVSLEALYPFPVVQYGNSAEDPMHCLPYVTGLSHHAFSEIRVNQSNLFYSVIHSTHAVGLVANSPDAFVKQGEYPGIQPLALTDCPVTGQYGWIKLRRLPLTDVAADMIHSITMLFS